MEFFGCLGKISKYILGLYMFVVSTHQRCATQSMVNGEATALEAARIMTHGIRIPNID